MQEHLEQQSTLVVVDDLSEPEDYWLTLTDAARITRRQEVTIRRWVAAGHLPVRRQPMGLTKRTSHVRASDLARLTPIIDPTAAISGATAHLDLGGHSPAAGPAPRRPAAAHPRAGRRGAGTHREGQILAERQHAADEGIAQVVAHTAATDRAMAAQVDTGIAAVRALSAHLADEGQALAARVLQVTETVEALHQRLDAAEHVLDHITRETAAAKTLSTTQQATLATLQEQVTRHETAGVAQVECITTLEAHLAHLRDQHQLHAHRLRQIAARADHSALGQEEHAATLAALAIRVAALEQVGERGAAGRRIRSRRSAASTRMSHLER